MKQLASRVLEGGFLRYLFVGGVSYVVNVILLNVFVTVFHWPAVTVAAPAAFLLTFFVSYTLQRIVAFRSQAGVVHAAIRYLLLVGVNTLAQIPLHFLGERAGLGLASRQLLATGVTTIRNYFVYKHWVYVDRHAGLPDPDAAAPWHARAARQVRLVTNLGGAPTPAGGATAAAGDTSGPSSAAAGAGEGGPR